MVDLKNIKTTDFWYIIGYIATDGHLSKDGRHINITSKDKDHLLAIKHALKLRNKIGNKYRAKDKTKRYFYLQFSDVKLYRYLLKKGFVQKKSINLSAIDINKTYFRDFLRGIIDGDGCISTWINKSNAHQQWSLRISSAAINFIQWLKFEIEHHYKIQGKLYSYLHKNKVNPIHILKFGKLATKIIIIDTYYSGALCLNRKYTKHILCLQDENKMINYGNIIARVA